jgi:GT2 family glycosyltransferase
MIPILAIPILNRGDFLLRCIRSIDYPVEKLLIVNNGNDAGVCAAIEQLEGEGDFELRTFKPGFNMGVAASWNWIMQNNPANYWLLVGNDIQFSPGDLRKIDKFVRAHPEYVMCPANWGHSLFAIRQACIDGAGYFDENYFPAYSEDQDHCRRINLAGLKWADVPDVHALHGEPPLWGSSTVWSDPILNKKSAVTQKNNAEYYRRKWGGDPGQEIFTHPYNNPELTVKDWLWDAELARANENPNFNSHSGGDS